MIITNPFEEIAERLSKIEEQLRLFKPSRESQVTPHGEQPDTLNLYQALEFLNSRGYTISKSKLYKATAAGTIPFKRFGSRLIFSRQALLGWLDELTIDANKKIAVYQTLAVAARKKEKGGKR